MRIHQTSGSRMVPNANQLCEKEKSYIVPSITKMSYSSKYLKNAENIFSSHNLSWMIFQYLNQNPLVKPAPAILNMLSLV